MQNIIKSISGRPTMLSMFLKEKMVVWCLAHKKVREQPKVRRKSVSLILIIVTKRAVNNFHYNTRQFAAAIPLQELLCLSLTKEMAFFNPEAGSDLTCPYRGTGGRRAAAVTSSHTTTLSRSCSSLAAKSPGPALSHSVFFSYDIFFLKTRELAWAVSEQDAAWTVD